MKNQIKLLLIILLCSCHKKENKIVIEKEITYSKKLVEQSENQTYMNNNTKYIKDKRTNLCFLIKTSYHASITCVPCDSLVMREINK